MKSTKPLWRISVATALEAEDAVMELLASQLGKPPTSYLNLETGVNVVSAFSEKKIPTALKTEIVDGLKEIKRCGLNIGKGKVEITRVKREDWAESWKKHFKAMEVGRALLIQPSWIKKLPRPGQSVIILDPGLSFGTGQHATTSFCLTEIVRCLKAGTLQSFLDIGTGSGILAIAAAKLGYQPVLAFDFDPESIRVAKANARVNKISGKLKIFRGDVTKLPATKPSRQFDLVCANLISNLLIAEKHKIAAQIKQSGTLVLAGILAAEFTQVQRAYAALGLKLVASKVEKEWRSGSFRLA